MNKNDEKITYHYGAKKNTFINESAFLIKIILQFKTK